MVERPDEGDGEALSPDDAFTLVGNETRIAILQTLWEAYDPYASDNAVPFSTLYERAGADDSGNFNYHLGKLVGHFVRRVEQGYELAAPGFEVVRSIIAGGITGGRSVASSPVEGSCVRCESPLELTYEDGTTWVRCTVCDGYWPQRGGELFGFSLPPRGLQGRDPDGILAATLVYSIHRFESMCDGVCPECGSLVDASLVVCPDHETDANVCDSCGSHFQGVLTFVCTACKFEWRSPGYAPISHHPALVSFYYDHGVEHVPTTWAAIMRGFDWTEECLSTDPPHLRITVSYDDDRIHFVVDETGDVVDVEP